MRGCLLALALLLTACGGTSRAPREPLPDLPTVKLEAFQPTIREEVEKALKAARSDPEDAAKVGELAMVLHAHQQNASAEACYERCRILEPMKFDWEYLLASVRAEQGKNEQAIENYRRSLKIDSTYTPAKVKLADLLLATGNLAEAEGQYRAALEDDEKSAIAWYGLGRVQSTKGELEPAAESYAKAVELYPQYGQAHYALALMLRRLKRTDESKVHFEKGEEFKIEAPSTGDRVLNAVRSRSKSPAEFLRAGVELDKQGRLKESAAIHLEVLKIDPNQVQAHINLISLYGRLGDTNKALEHYRQAMKINENLPDCHYDYGVVMSGQQKFNEAKTAFQKAVEINPFYAKAHYNLGVMLEREGNIKEAEASYRKAVENQPDYRMAHFSLGRIVADQGKLDDAIRHFNQIITPADQDTPGYLYALGIAWARKGSRGKAITYMRQARELATRFNQSQLVSSIDQGLNALEGK
jgi:tetratricopeptide (TPR) repeat protein